MTEERERKLYEEGESLANEAAKYGIGATELKTMFLVCQRKSIAFLEAYVKMQTERKLGGFGQLVLEMMNSHANSRSEIESVLRYMNMTYGYVRQMKQMTKLGVRVKEGTRFPPDIELQMARLIKPKIERLGFEKLTSWKQDDDVSVEVYLQRWPSGNPGILAKELAGVLKQLPSLSKCFITLRLKTERR